MRTRRESLARCYLRSRSEGLGKQVSQRKGKVSLGKHREHKESIVSVGVCTHHARVIHSVHPSPHILHFLLPHPHAFPAIFYVFFTL